MVPTFGSAYPFLSALLSPDSRPLELATNPDNHESPVDHTKAPTGRTVTTLRRKTNRQRDGQLFQLLHFPRTSAYLSAQYKPLSLTHQPHTIHNSEPAHPSSLFSTSSPAPLRRWCCVDLRSLSAPSPQLLRMSWKSVAIPLLLVRAYHPTRRASHRPLTCWR